jgi:toxin YoeB
MYEPQAQSDILYWLETDKRMLSKTLLLIKEVTRAPYEGSGNPEALKHNLTGYWSRRINGEHRLVYAVMESAIRIISCRGHYTDL